MEQSSNDTVLNSKQNEAVGSRKDVDIKNKIEQNKREKGDSTTTDDNNKSIDTNMTLSTKLSTDQLICKSPRESSAGSTKSTAKTDMALKHCEGDGVFYYGILQILFGLLMVVFGVLVIVHGASMSQIGGGLWGGCLAISTGATGLLSSARQWCPLKTTAQKFARTVFLAMSLISLAVAQLVVVLAATGLARDINTVEAENEKNEEEILISEENQDTAEIETAIAFTPVNYPSVMSNAGLLIVSAIQCVCAAVSSYKSARDVCPCFKKGEDIEADLAMNNSHAIVSSWLGKHNPPPIYLVAAPTSSLGKGSKFSGGLPVTPVFMPPQQMMSPAIVGYPLIPAPLGPVPSPIIPPPHRELIRKKRSKHTPKSRGYYINRAPTPRRSRSRSKSKSRESLREEDVVRTYTGLDRTIAEEFIDICDSRNASLCSDSSCTSTCMGPSCSGKCTGSHTDSMSQESLVHKL